VAGPARSARRLVNDPAGVLINSLCRPASSPQAITAGCTGKDGAALTDSSTACGMCSGEFFLFRGGCYKVGEAPGSEICTKAEGGKCTICKTEGNYIFKNPATSVTLGNECILCSDTTNRDGYKGVANCQTCTAPGSAGATTCSACQAGYVRDANANVCKKCGTGCSACSASDQQECTACLEGKYLDGTSCVDASSCTGAKYPDPKTNKCIQCNAAAEQGGIPECTACTYNDSLQKPVCSACGGPKPLLKTAIDGSTSCVNADGCKSGSTHFVNDSSDKCIPCNDTTTETDANDKGNEGYMTCTKNSGQAPVCSACLSGYYGTDICTKCADNCATCSEANNANKCLTCMAGFFLVTTGENKKCVACDSVSDGGREGCSTCSNDSTFKCTDCKPNYRRQQNGDASDDYTCTRACGDSKGHCPPPPSCRGQSSLHITTNCKPSRRRRSWTGCWGTRALDTPRTRRCSTGGGLSWHRCRQEVD
ncbi:Variant-specific surface protein, partial [Giardia duodenalis]